MTGIGSLMADLLDPPEHPYLNDPAGWAAAHGSPMWSKQVEIAESVRDHRRTAAKAAHGPGKSWTAARLAAWWIDVHPAGEAIVVTTAPTWPQVKNILWRELRRAHTDAELPGNITLDCNWTLDDGTLVAFGRKPADHDDDGFQGIHARFVLVIIDEGSGIPAQLVRAAASLPTNEHGRILIIGNPTDPTSEFKAVCDGSPDDGATGMSAKGWNTITISAFDTPNFTGETVPPEVADVLVSKLWVDELLNDVGSEESPLYISKVLGMFPTDATDGVIAWSWVTGCQHVSAEPAHISHGAVRELGIDVAGSDGGDETVIYERVDNAVGRRWAVRSSDPETVLKVCEQAVVDVTPSAVKIDSIGIGWGIMGGLRRSFPRLAVHGVNVGSAASDPARFTNLRAEIWWEVGRELSRDGGWDLTAVTDDSTLSELASPRWFENSSGRIQIESKAEIRKRLGRSTDNADALLLAFYTPAAEIVASASSYKVRHKARR